MHSRFVMVLCLAAVLLIVEVRGQAAGSGAAGTTAGTPAPAAGIYLTNSPHDVTRALNSPFSLRLGLSERCAGGRRAVGCPSPRVAQSRTGRLGLCAPHAIPP